MKEKPCGHAWKLCDFLRVLTGRSWRHIDRVYYCPECGTFGTRTVTFLDGTFAKANELTAIRQKETAEFDQAKAEWLKRVDEEIAR